MKSKQVVKKMQLLRDLQAGRKVAKKADKPKKVDADVNKDGKVDEKDVSLVKKMMGKKKKVVKKD